MYMHKGVLFSYEEQWSCVICRKMDGIEDHWVEWYKPDWERQISHVVLKMSDRKVKQVLFGGEY
jgi:hypothetical protein